MSLREDMHSLSRQITNSHQNRKIGLASIVEDIATLRQAAQDYRIDIGRAHREMAHQQQEILGKARADLTNNEAQRKSGVSAWMNEVASAHHEITRQQYAELTKGREDLVKAEARRKSDANTLMIEIASARREARQVWSTLFGAMHSDNSGGAAISDAHASPEIIQEPETLTPESAEEASSEVFNFLSNTVYDYLASHPDGTGQPEIEQEFDLDSSEGARVLSHLSDEGKVELRGDLYFAV